MTERWIDLAVARLGADPDRVRFLGAGQLSVAFLVEPDLVVRFPRAPVGVEHLRRERDLVGALTGLLDVALPVPGEADLDSPPGAAFATHRLVPGVVLGRATVARMRRSERAAVEDELARFLADLEAATPVAGRTGIRECSFSALAEMLGAEVHRLLAARLTPAGLGRADRELRGLTEADRGHRVLTHTDLGGNLVWDPTEERLGVLDFGGALVTDPVLDLASVTALDAGLAGNVGKHLPRLADRTADAALVQATFALQDAIYAARQADWDHVDAVLRSYR